jgi:hypothetical protein
MSTTNTLTGGGFQDCLGNPLSNGLLILQLNQDTVVNTNVYLCASDTFTIPLDENGNVSPTATIWPNDVMTPSTAFYYVSAYSATGELVYGPNNFQVISTPSPYPLSDWIPA